MVSVLITSKCNYKCSHCLFNCTMRGSHITQETLGKLPAIFENSSGVNIIGGEPTLNPNFEHIMRYLSNLTPYGHYRIVSNGSFIYNKRKAEKMQNVIHHAMRNKHDGVSLAISNDDFHRPFWKLPNHLNAIKWTFEDLGYGKHNNFFLDLSKRESHAVMSMGRAIKSQLDCDMDTKPVNCNEVADNPDEISYRLWEDITIFPNGDYYPCCNAGAKIGNVNQDTIEVMEMKLTIFFKHLKPHLTYGDCKNCGKINKLSMMEVSKIK